MDIYPHKREKDAGGNGEKVDADDWGCARGVISGLIICTPLGIVGLICAVLVLTHYGVLH